MRVFFLTLGSVERAYDEARFAKSLCDLGGDLGCAGGAAVDT